MKLVKTANGKQSIKMSKKEWENIGEKQGWITSWINPPMNNPGNDTIHDYDDQGKKTYERETNWTETPEEEAQSEIDTKAANRLPVSDCCAVGAGTGYGQRCEYTKIGPGVCPQCKKQCKFINKEETNFDSRQKLRKERENLRTTD